MTLSDEKTHITHIDGGFVLLGFHIQGRSWGDGRRVVLTIPSKDHVESRMLGQRARPVRRAGMGIPTPETVQGLPSPTQHVELDRRRAELLFHVLTEREEKNSVAIAFNESFGKAHMFRRTRARWCLNSTGSKRIGRPPGRT